MLKPGPKNSICDVPGITVGNAQDIVAVTGVTVVLAAAGATGSVDVRGGGPAGRETDLLSPENMVPGPDAICLSGGSAYGLGAGDAVVQALAKMGRGYAVADVFVHGPYLTLEASPETVLAGATLTMTTWGGQPGGPVLLAVVETNGTPLLVEIATRAFDPTGSWSIAETVPPGLSGVVAKFLSVGVEPTGEVGLTNLDTVTFR